MIALAQVASGSIQNAISVCKMEDAQQRIRRASALLMKAREDEQRRIARMLHETTSQDLLALKLNLGVALKRSGESGEEVQSLLRESIEMAKGTMQEIRTLSYVLHPPLLDESGLECALPWFVNGFAKRSEIDVESEAGCEGRDGWMRRRRARCFGRCRRV